MEFQYHDKAAKEMERAEYEAQLAAKEAQNRQDREQYAQEKFELERSESSIWRLSGRSYFLRPTEIDIGTFLFHLIMGILRHHQHHQVLLSWEFPILEDHGMRVRVHTTI